YIISYFMSKMYLGRFFYKQVTYRLLNNLFSLFLIICFLVRGFRFTCFFTTRFFLLGVALISKPTLTDLCHSFSVRLFTTALGGPSKQICLKLLTATSEPATMITTLPSV